MNRAPIPITVLRVKANWSKKYCEELHKGLQLIEGFQELSIDPKKDLVLIRGNAEPCLLVQEIGKTGKPVELIFYDKEPKIEQKEHKKEDEDEDDKSPKLCKEKQRPNHYDDHDNSKFRQNGRSEKKPHFCCRDDHDQHPPKKEDKTDNTCKDDTEDIFKHPYFRFCRSASSKEGENTSRHHADYDEHAHFGSRSSRYETSHPHCSRFSGGESAHDHHYSRVPPPPPESSCPYDFGDYDIFTHYFNDYNTGSCNVM